MISIVSLFLYEIYNKNILKPVPFFAMAMVSGFRYYVGRDYDTYMYFFRAINAGRKVKAEIGYKMLVRIVSLIGGNQQLVFLIMAIFTSYFFYRFIASMSSDYSLSTLLYLCLGPFYFSSYNTIREALAISIALFSINYIHVWWKYLLGIALASCFHTSAILLLILLFVNYIGDKYFVYYLISSSALIVIILSGAIDYIISHILPRYIRTITVYSQKMDYSYIVFLIMGLVLLYFLGINSLSIDKSLLCLLLMSCVLITVGLITSQYTMLFTRLASYCTPSIIIIIPKLSEIVKQKNIYRYMVVTLCIAYYFYIILFAVDLLPYNYNFILFE